MEVSVHTVLYRLSLLIITFLAVACHKGIDTRDGSRDEVYAVTFEINGFESFTKAANRPPSQVARNQLNHASSTNRQEPQQLYEGHLYYWSFNNETVLPDMALHSGSGLTYNGGQTPHAYFAGWAFDAYAAGQAVSMTGLEEMTIKMPITDAVSVSAFGFDMSSSGTGPKAFDLYYLFDGDNWLVFQEDNQFTNTNPNNQPKNSFRFEDWSEMDIENQNELWVRIVPREGLRDESGVYSPTRGTTRFDNIYLSGRGAAPVGTVVDKLHYYVFEAESGLPVIQYEADFDPTNTAVSMRLPSGDYHILFLRNASAADLMMPEEIVNQSSFYFSNLFSNHQASVFAFEDVLRIDSAINRPVNLERYYSQVKFEWTDVGDLGLVKRIVVSPLHEPFFYAPFNKGLSPSHIDQTEIDIVPDFSLSKSFTFNQFMGKHLSGQELRYHVEVYGEGDELLRDFDVSANVMQNVQLVFRGELLGHPTNQAGFAIHFNEEWDDSVDVEF